MEVTNGYKNATLLGNWWEDRQQEGVSGGRLAPSATTRARCMPWALAQGEQAGLFQSTSCAAHQHALASPPPAAPRRPKMAPAAGSAAALLEAHCAKDAAAAAAAATAAAIPGSSPAAQKGTGDPAARFLSSYRRTFDSDRQAALATRPRSDFDQGRGFPLNSKLRADTFQLASLCAPGERQPGRAGGRGEFTRWPGESGSRYGVSVFADEYAAGR